MWNEGSIPLGELVLSDSTLYGSTGTGGDEGRGTVFKINTNGSGFAVLKSFNGDDGNSPRSSLTLSGSTIYGTTSQAYEGTSTNWGTVFMIRTDGTGFHVLKYFPDREEGCPCGSLVMSGTNLYGTTTYGGGSSDSGVVFALSLHSPILTYAPESHTAPVGSTTGFHAGADGAPELIYQWFFNSTNVITEPTTNSDLILTNIQVPQSGIYTVVVTNNFGAVTSSPAILDVSPEPVIAETIPLTQKAGVGAKVELAVTAFGALPLAYQWFHDATNAVVDGTNSVLRLTDVQVAQSGEYVVVVTNGFGSVTSSPVILDVEQMVVTRCSDEALRVAMAPGGTVSFACDGTITLSNTIAVCTDTLLDPAGHNITISGGSAVRVFSVATNVNFTLSNVTIADGNCTNGAGILNDGGTLILNHVDFERNVASVTESTPEYWNRPGPEGGAIWNRAGTVNATNCTFSGNQVLDGREELGSDSKGGAVRNESGVFNLDDCTFVDNRACASNLPGVNGLGGAIHNGGTAKVVRCTFLQNSAIGGGWSEESAPYANGGNGGSGFGGAIYNQGSLAVQESALLNNVAVGVKGGDGCGGGIAGNPPYYYEVIPGGPGGQGGAGGGGAVFNGGTANLQNTTIALNTGTGGAGGLGGRGGYFWEIFIPPGQDGSDGSAVGAILDATGMLHATNCTLVANVAMESSCGGLQSTGAVLVNTILASNSPVNCAGTIIDLGHNLSSDDSCSFTNVGSLNDADPMLGPLADNGGPTWTMALLPGSPAIDSGDDAAAPATDQRGVPRPFGAASDIGAYECSAPILTALPPDQTAEAGSSVDFSVDAFGGPGTGYLWFFKGTDLISFGTNCGTELPDVQPSQSGGYTVLVTNAFGAVTSAPVMLNVIAPVGRRPVPAITLFGEAGEPKGIESSDSLSSGANWEAVTPMALSDTAQLYIDLSLPLPPTRFYRGWQAAGSSPAPLLDMHLVPAIKLTGNVGDSLRLDYINQYGPTDAWVTMDTVRLTNASQLYFDVSSIGQPRRLYRIVPVP